MGFVIVCDYGRESSSQRCFFPDGHHRLRPLLVDVDESSVPLPVVRLCDRDTEFLNKSAKTASMPYFCVRSDDDDVLHALRKFNNGLGDVVLTMLDGWLADIIDEPDGSV